MSEAPAVTIVRPVVNETSYINVEPITGEAAIVAILVPAAEVLSYTVIANAVVVLTVMLCNTPAPLLTTVVVAVEILL